MQNIAILVSGSGTNAENIIKYFTSSNLARVTLIVCDNSEAYAIERAKRLNISYQIISRPDFKFGVLPLKILKDHDIDFIVLAGFLTLLPSCVVEAFDGRIINIHPALLPAYGGTGMYGAHVHCAVIAAGDCESGITIHYVNEQYDSGDIIAQYRVEVTSDDTSETLATKIHKLEHEYFPVIIENEIKSIFTE